jgi:hypothetical protein
MNTARRTRRNQIASMMTKPEQPSGRDGAAKDRVGTRYPRSFAFIRVKPSLAAKPGHFGSNRTAPFRGRQRKCLMPI